MIILYLAECRAIYCSTARQAGANYIGSSVLTALVVRLVDTVYKPLLCTNKTGADSRDEAPKNQDQMLTLRDVSPAPFTAGKVKPPPLDMYLGG